MQLIKPVQNLFGQLQQLLEQLSNEQYQAAIPLLSNATIGQHIRHVIELFIELNQCYDCGQVNYEKRKRDYNIETNKAIAIAQFQYLATEILKENKQLILIADHETEEDGTMAVETNYYRELMYNIDHTVHHMALIKIGVDNTTGINLPADFGVAFSTLKYRKQLTTNG